ncbi:MAG: hypothetical protein Q8P81_00790 [Nanoarchaeota archaeon]|nr:hypothetical protein [Nanoarchaeota archaeon]
MAKRGKYSRRVFLKNAARVGAGTTLWGTGGWLLGKAFDYSVKPIVDSVLDTSGRVENTYNALERLNPFRSKSLEASKSKPISRRGFLSAVLSRSYEHPVVAGTSGGTVYGAGKYLASGFFKYGADRDIAQLKDERDENRKRISELEMQLGKNQGVQTAFITLGVIGLIFSFLIGSSVITGDIILEIGYKDVPIVTSIVFGVSLLLVLLGVKKKRS